MGIGNTTTSSAVISVLTGLDQETVTGKGAGLDNAGLKRKIEVIKEGIRIHKPDPSDGIDVLSKVGGLDRQHWQVFILAVPIGGSGSPGRSYYRCGGTGGSKICPR